MKKLIVSFLALCLSIAALPALASDYEDPALLPAHVRWLEEKMTEGDYGDEAYQFFFYEPISGYYYDTIFYVDGGQPKSHTVVSYSQGLPVNPLYYKRYGYNSVHEELYASIVSSGFDALSDCEGGGDMDVYYAHITPDGVSYVQMIGFDPNGDTPYAPLIGQIMENTRLNLDIKAWDENYHDQVDPWQRDYDEGKLGDEVFILTSFSTWNLYQPIIAIISIKDGKAVISGENGQRELTAGELARIKSFIAVNSFDSLPHYNNPDAFDGGGYRYIHISPEGTKFLRAKNAEGGQDIIVRPEDGSVYAKLERLVKEIYKSGNLRQVDSPTANIWGETSAPVDKVSISVNGSPAGECVRVDGELSAPLSKNLLDSLGIKRTHRPDMSTIVLNRGTELLMYEPNQSFVTLVNTEGYSTPDALAAALADSNAYENGTAKYMPIGMNVSIGRMPLEAICTAFGLEYNVNGNTVNINVPEAKNLDSDYVNRLTALLMAE